MTINENVLELRSLELLSDLQAELCVALNELGGRPAAGLLDFYRIYTAAHIHRAIEGYLYLRKSGRIDASKLLVRTAIEAAFLLQAVQKKPELFFRIAFTEFCEEKKWLRSIAGEKIAEALSTAERQWTEYKRLYHEKYPEHPQDEKELSLWEAAECAEIKGYYGSHYRLYCKFTHAAFKATTGSLNVFDREDNRTMVLSALSGVEALSSIGATSPNIEALKQRLNQLDET